MRGAGAKLNSFFFFVSPLISLGNGMLLTFEVWSFKDSGTE
jgi:hypothetical protein